MRELFGLRPAPEFAAWMESCGLLRDGRLAEAGEGIPPVLLSGLDAALARPALSA